MKKTYFASVALTAVYAALAAGRTVLTVTVSAPPANAAAAYLKNGAAQEVPLQPGEWHTLVDVDLADLQVKGTVGDTVTLVGGA
jgi:hypothetical protein